MLIGPQRTGTTWLHENLRRHPQLLFAREKEIHFFNLLKQPGHRRYRSSSLVWYLDHFTTESSRLDVLRGEATSSYAAIDVDLIDTIARLNPRLKAIMLVRDPVDRAWSQFKCMHRADGPARRMDAIADQYRDERAELRARGLIRCIVPGGVLSAHDSSVDRLVGMPR